MPRAVVLGAVPAAALDDALAVGTVVADDSWVALESLATAENAVADEIVGLAAEGRLAVVLGDVPPEADVYVVPDAHRLDLEELAGRLQQAPEDARVVVSGDPDQLPGAGAGAALRDLVDWGGVPMRDLRPDQSGGDALGRLGAAIRSGELPPPDPEDRSVVVTRCADDEEVVRRVHQLVTDSIPRVFGVQPSDLIVVTPLRRGTAGQEALKEAVPGVEVLLVHEIAGRKADAVVACFPGQAAGVLSRALVYSALTCASRHLSVVTAAGDALPSAVRSVDGRRRVTRLGALLSAGAAELEP